MIVRVCRYEEIDSTNVQAARLAESGAPHGTLVRAEKQNAGKGRRGRTWQSPYGVNLYFSLLLRPAFTPEKAPMLTLLMAVAAVRAIEHACGWEAGIKWPNDIVAGRRKVCGILTEMKPREGAVDYVVIGTGINVNMVEFPAEIQESATSLLLEGQKEISIDGLLENILSNFEDLYQVFEHEKNLAFIQEEYNRHLAGIGEEVRVLDPQGEYTGVSHGITAMGELLVEQKNKSAETEMIKVYAGEVSIRGMDGYV